MPVAVLVGTLLLSAVLVQAEGAPRGELTHVGNKWAWSGTGEVFVPQLVMYATPPNFYGNPGKVDRDVRRFLDDYGFNGFHVFVSCRWFDIGEPDCREADDDPAIDGRTLDALEMLITKTHRAGGVVHLWMWGDEERGQTPSARRDWGGLDGPVAQRVEAAIAERLGPLPGWSLGYGFDLDEWVTESEIHEWRDRMQERLPTFHFLGGRPQGPNNGRNHRRYTDWNQGLDYASYEHHKPSYETYVDALERNPDKPVMSEDRFRVLASTDPKHYTPRDIRRGLWHSTLAGGVANIWGHLIDGGSHELGSAPFPNRGQIRTYFEFVRGRFLADMVRCSGRSAKPHRRALCLGSTSGQYLFYREASSKVELDLRDLDAPAPAIAVDTRKPYEEIRLGSYSPGRHEWTAPYRSDWAIAVGRYDRARTEPATEQFELVELEATPTSAGAVVLEWVGGHADITVERSRDDGAAPGPFEQLATLTGGLHQYIDRDVVEGETYWYRVRSSSAYSTTVRVFTGRDAAVSALSPTTYRLGRATTGARYYVDRDYALASIPSFLEGSLLIRTANEDKLEASEQFLTFTISKPATIYVAYDRRARRLPYWLDEWEPVEGRLTVEGDGMRYFRLYRREFPAGAVVLGGNSAAGAEAGDEGQSHYIVAIMANQPLKR